MTTELDKMVISKPTSTDALVETLRDCANALGELLPREHAYRRLLERANRLLDRHDLMLSAVPSTDNGEVKS